MAKWGVTKPWENPPHQDISPEEIEPAVTEAEEDIAGSHGPAEAVDIDEEAKEVGLYEEADTEHPQEVSIAEQIGRAEKTHLEEE